MLILPIGYAAPTQPLPDILLFSNLGAIKLEAALWAFHHSDHFRDGCLIAVNLGDDADTTGAVLGANCRASDGVEGILAGCLTKLHRRADFEALARQLHAGSTMRVGGG